MIKTKRIYEGYNYKDGLRILVDRIWPAGVSKEKAHLSLWISSIAPSNNLLKWYSYDRDKWKDFRQRYFDELSDKEYYIELLKVMATAKNVTLLYSSKDRKHNNAVALKEFLVENSKYIN